MMPKRVLRRRATSFAVFALRYMTNQSPKERYSILKIKKNSYFLNQFLKFADYGKHGTPQNRIFLGIAEKA